MWGFDGMYMLNIFAIRATDPRDMRAHVNPKGYERHNDEHILTYGNLSAMTVCCWGSHGTYQCRGAYVEAMITNRYIFGLTKNRQPLHPLYLAKTMKPYLVNE